MRIAGGSETIARRLFEDLVRELPDALSEIRERFDGKDWLELWQIVHRLNGASAVCGVPALHHLLGELQPAISMEDDLTTAALLEQLGTEADRIYAADSKEA